VEANAGDEARIWARIPLSLAGIEFLEHRLGGRKSASICLSKKRKQGKQRLQSALIRSIF
jgi:hypothetical protein